MADPSSAALLIRVWLEDAVEFRARLLTLRDIDADVSEEKRVAVASSRDEVLDAVRQWLDGFTQQAMDPVDGDE